MSIITSEISSRTEVLAAGQNTKGCFSPQKSLLLCQGTANISLTASLLTLPRNTTIVPTASTWAITPMPQNLLGGHSTAMELNPPLLP